MCWRTVIFAGLGLGGFGGAGQQGGQVLADDLDGAAVAAFAQLREQACQ